MHPRAKERAINATPPPIGAYLVGEVPEPVLFNTWKHHAGALRARIWEAAARGEAGLAELAGRLVVQGSELMDLYTGALSPAQIAERVIADLHGQGRLALEPYRAWLAASGGYDVLTFADDASRWVVRLGDEGARYVHVHPARWAPATRRVRANVLKTAVMVVAYAAVHGGDPLEVALVNHVREQYLGLSPMGRLADDLGLQVIIELLRST
jgi:hypothetical protein